MALPADIMWHDDGHTMYLELHRAELQVLTVNCPGGACAHPEVGCVVQYFVGEYGLDCHVGICPADAEMSIAWSLVGNPREIEACQVWVISVRDDMWQAFADAQRDPSPGAPPASST